MKAAILCPGGGYRLIGANEGTPVAERFRETGYEAEVLNYAVGDRAVFTERGFADFEPARELTRALRDMRARIGDGGDLILAGFSAGGHLAAGYCLSHTMGSGADALPMPDALLLSYPMLQLSSSYKVDRATRKAFDIPAQLRRFGLPERAKNLPIHIWHSTTDQMIPFESSPAFARLLESVGARVTFATFSEGRHGDPATTPGWFESALDHVEQRR
jgi:endo-1,4-beta-xylanase